MVRVSSLDAVRSLFSYNLSRLVYNKFFYLFLTSNVLTYYICQQSSSIILSSWDPLLPCPQYDCNNSNKFNSTLIREFYRIFSFTTISSPNFKIHSLTNIPRQTSLSLNLHFFTLFSLCFVIK